jgi:hypothetical protein
LVVRDDERLPGLDYSAGNTFAELDDSPRERGRSDIQYLDAVVLGVVEHHGDAGGSEKLGRIEDDRIQESIPVVPRGASTPCDDVRKARAGIAWDACSTSS